jgi:hypothetical protein
MTTATIGVQISLRELVFGSTSLRSIVEEAISYDPIRIELMHVPDSESHIYIKIMDSSLDQDELYGLILRATANQFTKMDSEWLLNGLDISKEDAIRTIQSADPFIFFHLEKSLKSFNKDCPGDVYYIEDLMH